MQANILLETGQTIRLLQFDQFLAQQAVRKIFESFKEKRIEFHPTYKFKIGTLNWNQNTILAWTERVLMKEK